MDIKRKITTALFGTVFILTAIFAIMLFSEDSDVVQSTKESTAVTFGLILTYSLFAIILISVLIMAVRSLINKPKSAVVMLIGIGAVLVIFFICYALDAGEVTATYIKAGVTTSKGSKMVGGILNATFILFLLTIGASVFLSVKGLISKKNG